jgi:hypothetical protein
VRCQAKPPIGQFKFDVSPPVELPRNSARIGELPDPVLFNAPNYEGD